MKLLTLVFTCALLAHAAGGTNLTTAQIATEARLRALSTDEDETLFAKRWTEAFNDLDKTSNVTMTLVAGDDKLIEIPSIIEMRASSRFLFIKTKNEDGKFYRAVVHPKNIILLSETPK